MEGKIVALLFIALLAGLGVGYGSAHLSVANLSKEVEVTNFPALWATNMTNFQSLPTSWALSVPTTYTSVSVGARAR